MSESSIDKSINLGAVSEALNDKMDRDGLNANINPAAGYGVDYVVEWKAPTESDPTWYRLYRSRWVEQGGFMPSQNSGWTTVTITLPIPMTNRYYSIHRSGNWSDAGSSSCTIITKTTTDFSLKYASNTMDIYGTMWEVKGFAA